MTYTVVVIDLDSFSAWTCGHKHLSIDEAEKCLERYTKTSIDGHVPPYHYSYSAEIVENILD